MVGDAVRALSVCLILACAGCAGASNGEPSASTRPPAIVEVGENDSTDAPRSYALANGTGGLRGTIFDDSGLRLAEAAVSLLGTPNSTRSDSQGVFELVNITVGSYTLRVDRPDYNSVEQEITIEENRVKQVEVVLVLTQNVGAGYRPHTHDYWAGASEKVVIDRGFDWHEPYDHDAPYAGTGEAQRYYSLATQASGTNPCIYTGPGRSNSGIYFNNRFLWFDDPSQTVYEGTGSIEIKLDWTSNDSPLEELYFAYLAANMTVAQVAGPIKKGTPLQIPVEPPMWDSGHQSFTLWEMALCVTNSAGQEAAYVSGSVHVTMKIIRGFDVMPAPPHPRFWENGTEVLVVDHLKKTISDAYSTSRSQYRGPFYVKPPAPALVPPGTQSLRATLEWAYGGPTTSNKPWSLTYRPANVYPGDVSGPGDFARPTATGSAANSRTYEIQLKPGETDAFYQQKSNWLFFLNFEGEEAEWRWVNPCGNCAITLTLTVIAVKDPEFS